MQLSLNEICILPSNSPTNITSRSQVNPFDENGNLPIFVAPMTSVINKDNFQTFKDNKVIPILPRSVDSFSNEWKAYSLNETIDLYANKLLSNKDHILIDIANGHQKNIYNTVRMIKEDYPNITIMVGNIASPGLYLECCEAGVDYVRVGIGGGSVCSTSVLTGVHCSHVALAELIRKTKQEYCPYHTTKTIADGGINTIDKAIKCLALGYDYVMMGKCFAQCKEACGETRIIEPKIPIELCKYERKYYGMASIQGQKDISGGVKKSPEGIETWVPVNTTLKEFTNKFEAALRSAMSYTGAHNLNEFREVRYDYMSINEFNNYYK